MATKKFTATRKYNELYYQFPKVFITSEKYRSLSDKAKIAYMIFRSRLDLAIQRNQVDSKGYVYFEFTEQELATVLNCSRRSISTIKNELKDYELLEIEDRGFDEQSGKRNKARLYLGELDTTENDVYLLDTDPSADFAHGEEEEGFTDKAKEIGNFDEKNPCANFAQLLNNSSNYLDTENIDTTIDTSNQQKEACSWQETFIQHYSQSTFVSKDVLTWIAYSSGEWREAKEQLNMIYDSKRIIEKRQRNYNQRHGLVGSEEYRILGETFTEDLTRMYQRCIQNEKIARHEEKEIKNRKGFYFKSLLNFWECCARELNRKPLVKNLSEEAEYNLLQAKRFCSYEELEDQIYGVSQLPEISLHNWLEEQES
ncbi:replication initiator protein A [Enterococcus faecalis]|uniref:replication initiator protein A n=1 Tax=Enterococcus faecalis TaxID=1351 RepID=UPI001CF3C239|nr:replication initiator protein A [Enterococcus faecalis]MCA6711238.1 replication initiator protein A [Enterococcus faecalis]MCA6730116.1 replication initiator protein A [Enterococcus faecalis]